MNVKVPHINVIGAGLAGCEAAYQAAKMGVNVTLYEMKPFKYTPAHTNPNFAELVCSNSLRSDELSNAIGVLKAELRSMDSLIMEAADNNRVAAGSALAVDRNKFSTYVTDKILSHPNIDVVNKEVSEISPDEITVIASGPLTSDSLAEYIRREIGLSNLHFFDAAAPIIDFSSINMNKAFFASRYNKGDADYINCPMNEEEYKVFYNALINAEEAELHNIDKDEKLTVFEGCMPVEVMAKRGFETLLYGPLKPVGIENPETKENYYAVVQLRKENNDGTMYNIVGFQTHLKFGEQKRVFSLIPGLENATFLRYGVMHRNTYLNSPGILDCHFSMVKNKNVYFAGQMTGVEGYIESASSGLVAGINMAKEIMGEEKIDFPTCTALGGLSHYISNPAIDNFQPMNVTFGIIDSPQKRFRKKREKNAFISQISLEKLQEILPSI